MTPQELLEEVKGRFVVLYHKDDATLQRLLRQAMGKYQDKAGVLMESDFPAGTDEADMPQPFLCVAACHDESYRHVPVKEDMAGSKLYFRPVGTTAGGLTLHWLARLRDWPLDVPLPHGCTGLVGDYLEALINIPNTARARDVNRAIDGPTSELASEQELKARLVELEMAMEESRAMLPPIMAVCH